MIARLHGTLLQSNPVILDIGGIGYEIIVSNRTVLPSEGEQVTFLIQQVIREDANLLYGFTTSLEKSLFKLLVDHVSGVGPKTAMDLLSGVSPEQLQKAIATGDVKALKVKGVGIKNAERIVLELKDKVGAVWTGGNEVLENVILGLMALGYKAVDSKTCVEKIYKDGMTEGVLFKEALKGLK